MTSFPAAAWWPRPRVVVQIAAVLGAAVATAPIMGLLRRLGDGNLGLLAIPTTVALSLLLLRRGFRAQSLQGVALRCLLGGLLAGALNQGLVILLLGLISGDASAIPLFFIGTLLGFIYVGGPLGVAYGAAYAPLVASVMRAERRPAHLGAVDVMLAAGLWLGIVGMLVAVAASGVPALAGGAVAVVGLLAAALALHRHLRCARWLRRVSAGSEPGWRVAQRRGTEDEPDLLPLFPADGYTPGGVLLACSESAQGPYRGPENETAVALVPLQLGRVRVLPGRGSQVVILLAALVTSAILVISVRGQFPLDFSF